MALDNSKIQYSRQLVRRFEGAGLTPTIPANDDFTITPHLNTDVIEGEIIENVTDEKAWIRAGTSIIEITGGTAFPYTPEDVANKAVDFTTINDTLYPSVKAVNDKLATYASLAGADTQIQYNNAGVMGASSDFTYNNTSKIFNLNGYSTQSVAFTSTGSFTVTGGATTNLSRIITYTANTNIKVGDSITGTGIPSNSIVVSVISATSCILSQRASATNTGLTFTIYPAFVANRINQTFTGTSNYGAIGLLIEQNQSSANAVRGLLVVSRNNSSSATAEFVGNGPQLYLTSDSIGNVPSTWQLLSSSGSGGAHGNFVIGIPGSPTIFNFTSGGNLAFGSITASSTLPFGINGPFSSTANAVGTSIGYSNATVTPTAGTNHMIKVGIQANTSQNFYWNPTSGTAILNGYTCDISMNQSGSATGGVNAFNASPVVNGVASGGFVRGFYSNINSGTGSRHQLYLAGTAPNYINGVAGFNTLTPNAGCQVDIVSTTLGVGLPATTGALITANSTARTGTVMYQTDGTEGLMVKKSSGWAAVGGGTSILRASKACTDEDGGTITAWAGTTDYTYTITVTGATVGQNVIANLDNAMASALTGGDEFISFAWVSATNTVKVRVRVGFFVNVTGNITVAVI